MRGHIYCHPRRSWRAGSTVVDDGAELACWSEALRTWGRRLGSEPRSSLTAEPRCGLGSLSTHHTQTQQTNSRTASRGPSYCPRAP